MTVIYKGPKLHPEENLLALNNVSFVIKSSEVVTITGDSGSGKTTLLNVLAGQLEPDVGVVEILSNSLYKMNQQDRQRFISEYIFYVKQKMEENLIFKLTVRENMELVNFIINKNVDILKTLRELEISHLIDQPVMHLSGGEKQLVCLAMGLMQNSKILILDEPTSSLDSTTKHKVMRKIIESCKSNDITLVYTSHDPEISLYSNLVLGIYFGRFDRIIDRSNTEIKEEGILKLMHGLHVDLTVDSKGAVYLPKYALEKLDIKNIITMSLKDGFIKLSPKKNEMGDNA